MPKSSTLRFLRSELKNRNIPGEVAYVATWPVGWFLIQNDVWSGRQRLGYTCAEALEFVRRGAIDWMGTNAKT
jgi:hypothetical protein